MHYKTTHTETMYTFRTLGLVKVLKLDPKEVRKVIGRIKRIKDVIPPKSKSFFAYYGIDMSVISTKDELNGYLSYLGVKYYYKKQKSLYRLIKWLIRSLKL